MAPTYATRWQTSPTGRWFPAEQIFEQLLGDLSVNRTSIAQRFAVSSPTARQLSKIIPIQCDGLRFPKRKREL
jgi:hypothetical protein